MKSTTTPQKYILLQPIFYFGNICTNGGNINFADQNSTINSGVLCMGGNSGQINLEVVGGGMDAQIMKMQCQIDLLQEQIKVLCDKIEYLTNK